MARLSSAGQNGTTTDSGKQRKGITNGTAAADPATDLRRWRVLDERGRQTWHYLTTDKELEAWPQTVADKHFLGLPLVRSIACFSLHTNADVALSRTYRTSHRPRHLELPPTMPSRSSPTCSCHRETGAASMEDLCFFCRVW